MRTKHQKKTGFIIIGILLSILLGCISTTSPISGIKIDKDNILLKVGEKSILTATVTPENASDKTVNWMSTNPEVASVTNGEITAVSEGTTLIVVSTKDGSYTKSCNIIVEDVREPQYILVEGGTFIMGDIVENDIAEHIAKVGSFYISKYETTQKEYCNITGLQNPSNKYGVGDDIPVYNVNGWDAVKYCNKLSEKEGLPKAYNEETGELLDAFRNTTTNTAIVKGYRLPTEEEWEFAAKGGKLASNPYKKFSGSNIANDVAWCKTNIVNGNFNAKRVGMKKCNELGIFDMSGNVAEMCYKTRNFGFEISKRGGNWNDEESYVKPTTRDTSAIVVSNRFYLGFRPVRSK